MAEEEKTALLGHDRAQPWTGTNAAAGGGGRRGWSQLDAKRARSAGGLPDPAQALKARSGARRVNSVAVVYELRKRHPRLVRNTRDDSFAVAATSKHRLPFVGRGSTSSANRGKLLAARLEAGLDGDDEGDDEVVEGGLSKLQASVNLVKCAIGAGSFSLPFAFREGGLAFSFFGTLFFGWISAYTVNMLAISERVAWRKYTKQLDNKVALSPTPGNTEQSKFTYPALGRAVFPNLVVPGTSINIMEVIIYGGIALTGLGVCAAYVDFITSTLPQVFPALSVGTTTLIIAPIFWLLSLLRTYRFLAFTSILGDVAVTAGIISVVVYGATKHSFKFDVPQFEVHSFPKFIGSTSFLFAIHIVILPIMQSMRERNTFKAVTLGSYTFITVINGVFGALCFMLFGEDTKANVVHNLPANTFLDIVKVLLCVDLMFSLPMILAAAREVVEEPLVAGRKRHVDLIRNTLRTVLVGLVFAICFGVPDFGDMVSLVGGLVNSLMGFILPPMINLKQQWDLDQDAKMLGDAANRRAGAAPGGDQVASAQKPGDGGSTAYKPRFTGWLIFTNVLIMMFGATALVVSTYYTIDGILHPSS